MTEVQPRLRRIRNQIPNALSLSRIAMAIIFPLANVEWRFTLVILALASEFLDGFLARRWRAVTLLGQALDPIADKLFILATVFVLIQERRMSWFQFSLVAMRDLVVAFGCLVLLAEYGRSVIGTFKPRWSGKIATTFQFVLLIWLYLDPTGAGPFIIATAIVSGASAVDYLYAVMHRKYDEASEFS